MDHQQELSSFERCLVLDDALLGDADAIKPGSDGAESTDNRRSLEGRDNPGDDWARSHQRSDARDHEERRPEQHSPDPTPERALLAPMFHTITGGVVTDDVFLGVISLSDNRQRFHIETGLLEFLHTGLGLVVLVK